MRSIRSIAQYLAVTVLVVNYASLCGQAVPARAKSAAIAVSIAMQKDHLKIGETNPIVVLTIRDIADYVTTETSDNDYYRVHVEGEKGEPPKTLLHRQLLREPGVPDLPTTLGPFTRYIAPGQSVDRTLYLSAYYDLSASGKYTVYLDVRDYESGIWLRTNTATFEVHPQTQ